MRIAIFVSGNGSNMQAILKSIQDGALDAECVLVFSNNPQAPALEIARSFGVNTAAVAHRGMTREAHEDALLELLLPHRPDFVVLAGYMRVLTPGFLESFRDPRGYFRVINIHPSLLPAFPGAHAYEDAFEYGVRLSGITVHLADEKVDYGPILAQAAFPRYADDTLETFRQRGLALEHRLYPEVLQSIATDGVKLLPQSGSRLEVKAL